MNDQPAQHILNQLQKTSKAQNLETLTHNLEQLQGLITEDMEKVQNSLSSLLTGPRLVEKGAQQLLSLGGKRLRPLCVLLAAQVGQPQKKQSHDLALAVELIHSATLLHDDVVDVATERRGAPSIRVLYGNALSIFAGDLLLIEAIRLVQKTNIPDLLDKLIDVIEEMIFSESLQLENRGSFQSNRDVYFQIIQGKTASLFRFALYAGGCAGQLQEKEAQALSLYGFHLGIAFQIIDDILDFSGEHAQLGKELFADLQEGKMTLPLLIACEKNQKFSTWLKEQIISPLGMTEEGKQQILAHLEQTHALQEASTVAALHIKKALASLENLPWNGAVEALASVAQNTLARHQ